MSKKTFGTLMDIVNQPICAAADTIGSRLVPNISVVVSLVEERDKMAGMLKTLQTLVATAGI
jgi:hypothetical protein